MPGLDKRLCRKTHRTSTIAALLLMFIFLVYFLLSGTTNLSCTSENCLPIVRYGVVVPSTFQSDTG